MDFSLEGSPYAIPVISVIIERETDSGKEILIQTRIAKYDKLYYGCIEIPAGKIDRFENIFETVKREVKEETGLEVIEIKPDVKSEIYTTGRGDASFVFQPYCGQQLLKGNIPWVGFVFICKVKEGLLKAAEGETKDLHWIKLDKLNELVKNAPEKIFALQLSVLDFYLEQQSAASEVVS